MDVSMEALDDLRNWDPTYSTDSLRSQKLDQSLHVKNLELDDLETRRGLKVLDASFSNISSLPPSIKHLKNLTELDCRSNDLANLPSELSECTSLKKVLLYKNLLERLPDVFKGLSKLEVLDVSCNLLQALPPSLCFLTLSLQVLDLENNRLVEIPPEIGNLRSLKKVNFSKNRIKKLPVEIARLGHLRELDVSFNQLTDLSLGIFPGLGELKECYLQSNLLSTFPPDVSNLKRLEVLDLKKNPLTSLPSELRMVSTLDELRVDSILLKSPPADICKKGLKAIFAFFEESAQALPVAENCTADGPGLQPKGTVREKQTFKIFAVDKAGKPRRTGGDLFTITVERMDVVFDQNSTIVSQNIKAIQKDEGNGEYSVEYDAKRPGVYTIQIKYGGKHIGSSPKKVLLLPSEVDPAKTAIVNPVRKMEAGGEEKMTVLVVDPFGNRIEPGEEGAVGTGWEVKELLNPDKMKITLVKNAVALQTTVAGNYRLEITYKGKHIKESPLDIAVLPGPTYAPNCSFKTKLALRFEAGVLSSFLLQSRDRHQNPRTTGGDVYTAVFTSISNPDQVVTADIIDNQNGEYQTTFCLKQPGLYNLAIKLQQPSGTPGRAITGSPFQVEAFEPKKLEADGQEEADKQEKKKALKMEARASSTVEDLRRRYEEMNTSSSPSILALKQQEAKLSPFSSSVQKALKIPEGEQKKFFEAVVFDVKPQTMTVYPVSGHLIYLAAVQQAIQTHNSPEKVEELLNDAYLSIRSLISFDLGTEDLIFWLSNCLHLLKSLEYDEGGKWKSGGEGSRFEDLAEVEQKGLKHLTLSFQEKLKELLHDIYTLILKSIHAQLTVEKLSACFLNNAESVEDAEKKKLKPGKLKAQPWTPTSASAPTLSIPQTPQTPSDFSSDNFVRDLSKLAGDTLAHLLDFIQKLNPSFEKPPSTSNAEELKKRSSTLEPKTLREVDEYMRTLEGFPKALWEEIGLAPITQFLSSVFQSFLNNDIPSQITGLVFSQIMFYIDATLFNTILNRISKDKEKEKEKEGKGEEGPHSPSPHSHPHPHGHAHLHLHLHRSHHKEEKKEGPISRDEAANMEANLYALSHWARAKGLLELVFPLVAPSGSPLPNPALSPSQGSDFFLQQTHQTLQLIQLSASEINNAKEIVTRFSILNQYHLEKIVRMVMEIDKEVNMQAMVRIVEFAKIRRKKRGDSNENTSKFADPLLIPKLSIPMGRPMESIPLHMVKKLKVPTELLSLLPNQDPLLPTSSSSSSLALPRSASLYFAQLRTIGEEDPSSSSSSSSSKPSTPSSHPLPSVLSPFSPTVPLVSSPSSSSLASIRSSKGSSNLSHPPANNPSPSPSPSTFSSPSSSSSSSSSNPPPALGKFQNPNSAMAFSFFHQFQDS